MTWTAAGSVASLIPGYRLYDIDVVLNLALVYTALSWVLASVYLGSVLLQQLALDHFTAGSSLAVVPTTVQAAHASLWLRSPAVDR